MRVYGLLSDEELLTLLKQGKENALTEIHNRYWKKLYYIAVSRLEDEDEAEECVQDVFLGLWHVAHKLELKASLVTYLSRSVKNRVINMLVKRAQNSGQQNIIYLKDEPLSPAADYGLLEKEILLRIETLISQLPDKCQLIYRMKQEENKGNKEIATILKISEDTVKGHYTKAVNTIKGSLSTFIPYLILMNLLK